MLSAYLPCFWVKTTRLWVELVPNDMVHYRDEGHLEVKAVDAGP